MSIHKHTGDLLEVDTGIIVHGCNAQGVMGSGVAKAIRARWPEAFEVYQAAHDSPDGLQLGSVSFIQVGKHLWVANAITQRFYGRDHRRYVDYDAVQNCFEQVARFSQNNDALSIHFPLIGCGLGGGRWSEVAPRIVAGAPNSDRNLWDPNETSCG
ncbi:macro domain-containing protein [Denitromonas iodatirespirans]|uniref:Macro domain-containing protein n=1 Tax=Denitromonas iodatirespirans TaxID=2795389 RepID=A0A944H9I1_DENI1|nr:macro domain-containing protein [Denitromonas iodatirespirans]MBT0963443.1 macro domain-containing protein [Denitromonas iodatirespirans]